MNRHKCPRCKRRTLTTDGTICNTYRCNWYAGNTADDFMLWRLDCMSDPVLRWTMTQFLIWCEDRYQVTRRAFEYPYDWADPGSGSGLA